MRNIHPKQYIHRPHTLHIAHHIKCHTTDLLATRCLRNRRKHRVPLSPDTATYSSNNLPKSEFHDSTHTKQRCKNEIKSFNTKSAQFQNIYQKQKSCPQMEKMHLASNTLRSTHTLNPPPATDHPAHHPRNRPPSTRRQAQQPTTATREHKTKHTGTHAVLKTT